MRAAWEFQQAHRRQRRRALIGQAVAALFVVAITFTVAMIGWLLIGLVIVLLGW